MQVGNGDRADTRVPGLLATIAYLRPAARGRLLQLLSELGVFVRETASPQSGARPGQWEQADVAIVVGDESPEHLAICRWLSTTLAPATLAIAPDAECARLYLAAGAMEAVRDGDSDELFAAAMSRVARHARVLREARADDDDLIVFGDVSFRRSQAALRRGERTVRLTSAERQILLALVECLGEPVPHSRLCEATGGFEYQRLKTAILRLRRKVESLGADPVGLSSVRGFGYVLRH